VERTEFNRLQDIINALHNDIWRFKVNQDFYDNKRFISSDNADALEREFKHLIRVNKMLSDLHIVANSLKDNKPSISVVPKSSSREDIEKAEQLQRFLYAFFHKHKFYDENLYKLHIKRLLFGTVGVFSGYVNDGNNLDYKLKILSPFEFFFDPDIEDYFEQKYCYLLTFVKTDNRVSTPFDNLKIGFVEPDFYDVYVDYFERGGKHKRFDSKGNLILEEDNPYGDRLPVVYAFYYYRPHKYLGYGLADIWRVYQSVLNIILSKFVKDGLTSGVIAIAPRGALDEDIELGDGKILMYDSAVAGINNIPKIDKIEALPQSLAYVYNLIQQLYMTSAPLFPVETGEISSYASGTSKQAEMLSAQVSSSFAFHSMNAMFTTLARNIIEDIRDDKFGYFTEQQIFEYIGDENEYYKYTYKDLKDFDADVYITVSDILPVDTQTLGTLAFTQMVERSKNPVDYEAQKFMSELYKRYNIAYVTNRSRDENVARFENTIIEKILDLKISDVDIQLLMDMFARNDLDAIEKTMGGAKYEAFHNLIEYLKKIEPKSYDNHVIHLEVHYDVVKTPAYKNAEEWKQKIIDTMIDIHRQMAGGGWSEKGSILNSLVQKIVKKQANQPQVPSGVPLIPNPTVDDSQVPLETQQQAVPEQSQNVQGGADVMNPFGNQ
jgi:hypothetical protein